jgi:hypothetical protein
MDRAFSPQKIFSFISLGVAQGYDGSRRWRCENFPTHSAKSPKSFLIS